MRITLEFRITAKMCRPDPAQSRFSHPSQAPSDQHDLAPPRGTQRRLGPKCVTRTRRYPKTHDPLSLDLAPSAPRTAPVQWSLPQGTPQHTHRLADRSCLTKRQRSRSSTKLSPQLPNPSHTPPLPALSSEAVNSPRASTTCRRPVTRTCLLRLETQIFSIMLAPGSHSCMRQRPTAISASGSIASRDIFTPRLSGMVAPDSSPLSSCLASIARKSRNACSNAERRAASFVSTMFRSSARAEAGNCSSIASASASNSSANSGVSIRARSISPLARSVSSGNVKRELNVEAYFSTTLQEGSYSQAQHHRTPHAASHRSTTSMYHRSFPGVQH